MPCPKLECFGSSTKSQPGLQHTKSASAWQAEQQGHIGAEEHCRQLMKTTRILPGQACIPARNGRRTAHFDGNKRLRLSQHIMPSAPTRRPNSTKPTAMPAACPLLSPVCSTAGPACSEKGSMCTLQSVPGSFLCHRFETRCWGRDPGFLCGEWYGVHTL